MSSFAPPAGPSPTGFLWFAALSLGFSGPALAQCELQKIYGIGAVECEQFGKGVDMEGDRIVVGGHSADDDPTLPCATGGTGVAYVFDRVGSGWIQSQRLLASDGGENDEFGNSVTVFGDIVAVGAEYHDFEGVGNTGAVYAYELQNGTWVEVAKIVAPDTFENHYFGRSVSLFGETLVCGTRFDKDNGFRSGAAYVFQRDEFGDWGFGQKLLASDGEEYDLFGNSVAVHGDTIVAGAYWVDGAAGEHTGAAYVYEFDGVNWNEVAKLEASDQVAEAEFGRYVATDGNRILVGAVRDLGSGSAYVFERQAGSWVETAKLIPSDGAFNHKFGESCEIDGDHLIIGSRNADNPQSSGTVYLYSLEDGAWVESAKLKPLGIQTGDIHGYNCALSGDIVVGGSPFDYGKYGTASIYSISGACMGQPYGSEFNPPGSMIQLGTDSQLGSTLSFGIHNPLGTQAVGSIPLLFLAGVPDPSYPTGNILNFGGMWGPDANCEMLIPPTTFFYIGAPWQGAMQPAPVDLPLPTNPVLAGAELYFQGALLDTTASQGVYVGCTTGLRVTLED